jgi:uncharacterized protein
MTIQLHLESNKGVFFIEENGERLAEMTFRITALPKMIIDHTEVNKKLSGKGAGKQLVAQAVEYARLNKLKITPLCPFAKAVLEKTDEYRDALF